MKRQTVDAVPDLRKRQAFDAPFVMPDWTIGVLMLARCLDCMAELMNRRSVLRQREAKSQHRAAYQAAQGCFGAEAGQPMAHEIGLPGCVESRNTAQTQATRLPVHVA